MGTSAKGFYGLNAYAYIAEDDTIGNTNAGNGVMGGRYLSNSLGSGNVTTQIGVSGFVNSASKEVGGAKTVTTAIAVRGGRCFFWQ